MKSGDDETIIDLVISSECDLELVKTYLMNSLNLDKLNYEIKMILADSEIL